MIDGTQKILSQQSADLAYLVSEVDSGIYEDMNKGVAAADSDLVIFLNAGDTLFASKSISEFANNYYSGGYPTLWLCGIVTDDGDRIDPIRIGFRSQYNCLYSTKESSTHSS